MKWIVPKDTPFVLMSHLHFIFLLGCIFARMHFCPDPVPATSGCTNYIHSLLPMCFPSTLWSYSLLMHTHFTSFGSSWWSVYLSLFLLPCSVLYPRNHAACLPLSILHATCFFSRHYICIWYFCTYCTHIHTQFSLQRIHAVLLSKRKYLRKHLIIVLPTLWNSFHRVEHSYDAFEWFWSRGLVLVQPTQQSNETSIHLFLHPHRADIRTAMVMSCSQNAFVLI